jgi:hypothetical protein
VDKTRQLEHDADAERAATVLRQAAEQARSAFG